MQLQTTTPPEYPSFLTDRIYYKERCDLWPNMKVDYPTQLMGQIYKSINST
jgi:hypothetical protein